MPEELFQDRVVTGILEGRIERVPDQFKKGGQKRITGFFA